MPMFHCFTSGNCKFAPRWAEISTGLFFFLNIRKAMFPDKILFSHVMKESESWSRTVWGTNICYYDFTQIKRSFPVSLTQVAFNCSHNSGLCNPKMWSFDCLGISHSFSIYIISKFLMHLKKKLMKILGENEMIGYIGYYLLIVVYE